MKNTKMLLSIVLLGWTICDTNAAPMGTAFTYQGRLNDGAVPATGLYDLRFTAYDSSSGGNLFLPGAVTNVAVPVTNGLFTTLVDLGAAPFKGLACWLDIGVRSNGTGAAFAPLAPRQQITPTPHALYASMAGVVSNGSVMASQLKTAGAPSAGQILAYDGSSLAWQNPAAAGGAWAVDGNNAVNGNFLGTLNNLALDLRVNNSRALRLEPNATSPNVIAGWSGNSASPGIMGGTIGGGGAQQTFGRSSTNKVTDDFCTVSGGANNVAGNDNGIVSDGWYATVGGGQFNRAEGVASAIGGGSENRTSNNDTTVGGGYLNSATGLRATVGGGHQNDAANSYSTVAGGLNNDAIGEYSSAGGGSGNLAGGYWSAIAGGGNNRAPGFASAVPGGLNNSANADYSLAAGANAFADHRGSFVWADSTATPPPFPTGVEFHSQRNDEFAVRARGGARFQAPHLRVSGSGNEDGYIGGDGLGGEVHVGSLNPVVSRVALYNLGGFFWMDLDVRSITIHGGADLAEPFQMSAKDIPKGAVVVIDPDHPGRLKLSEGAYDKRVAGIVSGANGVKPGITLQQEGVLDGGQNVALSGRVYVQADASNGAIEPGDLLTTSDVPGHAMKASDSTRAQGAILGKAMSALKTGQGMVLVLVSLQ